MSLAQCSKRKNLGIEKRERRSEVFWGGAFPHEPSLQEAVERVSRIVPKGYRKHKAIEQEVLPIGG